MLHLNKLPVGQIEILLLMYSGMFRQAELAKARGRSKSTIYAQTEKLAEKGLIEKRHGGMMVLTKAGRSICKQWALVREGGNVTVWQGRKIS